MAIRLPRITHARQILRWFSLAENHIHKGYFAVYVGEGEKKRFAVPVSFLRQSSFQELLNQAEEGFGFDHPMGALTIPCSEAVFIDLTSYLGRF